LTLLDFLSPILYNINVNYYKAMTLTSKFKKDISILRAAANKEIYLDIKNPKLYKKVKRYYEGLQYINLKGEDPDADYNAVVECLIEDLKL
tara:strand:- start:43 stop:315 length:273 start_codon:yes stop_codon:yes gene_type:complete